ncbi:hypothetical protein MATL_G00257860 [Megalops atlanticus]|uniref:Uncharacterized protein n=1 Tax=Megalops atlanticus TaxID=7932 RepID=A0A9D3PEQ9_MEGAT|nr:hypothetical protein MATL_G00257860 [Megalops atlanticus]
MFRLLWWQGKEVVLPLSFPGCPVYVYPTRDGVVTMLKAMIDLKGHVFAPPVSSSPAPVNVLCAVYKNIPAEIKKGHLRNCGKTRCNINMDNNKGEHVLFLVF